MPLPNANPTSPLQGASIDGMYCSSACKYCISRNAHTLALIATHIACHYFQSYDVQFL